MKRALPAIALHALLVVGALLTLAPLLWMVSASFMPTGQANTFPPPLLPSRPTLEHYFDLFTRLNLARTFANSVVVTLGITLSSLVVNSMAGYAFAKLRFRGRDAIFRVLVAAMVIPAQVGMMPLFLMVKGLGLVNTPWGVMIPGLAGVFGIFMIRQFALSIPDELLDAARIDGASEFRIYWTVVLPVLRPILVTMATFSVLSAWNDFMWPLIVLSDDRRYTLPVALASLVGEHVQDTELMMAGSVLTVLPVLIVFLVMQRSYVRGVLMGSVKG
ncbi:MAG TPA: carbohydrate ABC transporter permease [Candidatus Acidoferrales bacterium]|nr:carbohydrate ABC transporter permease [Candidatus Acidoferrales bacterium]